MENEPKPPPKEPIHETSKEQVERQLLELQVEAGLADERDVLAEVEHQIKDSEEILDDIRKGIERSKNP